MQLSRIQTSEAVQETFNMQDASNENEYGSKSLKNQRIRKHYQGILDKEPGETTIQLDLSKIPLFMKEYALMGKAISGATEGALLTAWLPYIASNIGNRVYITNAGSKHYCKLWMLLAGPSSISRKSTCLALGCKTMEPFLESLESLPGGEFELQNPILSNTTQAKLMELLALNPNRLWELDEFGTLLANDKKLYNAGLREDLISLYDGRCRNLSNMDRNTRIKNPAISIVGATVPETVASAFASEGEQSSGFLQRICFCFIGYDTALQVTAGGETDAEDLRRYDDVFSVFRQIPGSHELKLSSDQKQRRDGILNEIIQQNIAERKGRIIEYATRIYSPVFNALVILISLMKEHQSLKTAIDNGNCDSFFNDFSVSDETVDEALYFCSYYLENAQPLLTMITREPNQKDELKVIRFLLQQGTPHVDHSKIMNKLHLNAKTMKTVMGNLIEKNLVSSELVPSCGVRPKQIYSLVDPQDV